MAGPITNTVVISNALGTTGPNFGGAAFGGSGPGEQLHLTGHLRLAPPTVKGNRIKR